MSSTNARYEDWASLSEEEYEASKRDLIETTLATLEKYVPNVRSKVDHVEASTPRTFEHYTRHVQGASFGTKFEGLAVSRGFAAANYWAVSCGQRGNHHVGLAGGDELRRDCGQRRRFALDEIIDQHRRRRGGVNSMSLAEIEAAIPHRPPFLMIDEIVAREADRIVCRKRFREDDWFFAGHYPNSPLVPGVLLCEAVLQAGAALLANISVASDDRLPVVTRMNEVRFKNIVRPSDTIEIEVHFRERLADAYFFEGKVTSAGKLAARLEFACMLVPRSETTT